MRALENFLRQTQTELFEELVEMYSSNAVISKENYILVCGEVPIMLVAHLDTVHKESVKHICKTDDGNILMSPQGIGGDDRCGVYALVNAYEIAKNKPYLLFTCNEEVGCLGAKTFRDDYNEGILLDELSNLKMIVEIDRRGKNDAVYYKCKNFEFEEYITSKGFATDYGTSSDISYIAPTLGVAAVNLSSGYYNAHKLYEYINRSDIDNTLKKVLQIVAEVGQKNFPQYCYAE